MGDFDIRPLELDDFPVHDTASRMCIQHIRLSVILGNIADYSTQKVALGVEEVTALTQSLSSWIRDLPEDLRLFDTSGLRRPYQFPIIELYIVYFSTLILLQALQVHGEKKWPTTVQSTVASSCIARLYEEMYYRDHVCFLLPIHSFFCMVSAVPQMYYRPQCKVKKDLRQEELDIIRSVVKKLQARFGGASRVARNISRLENELERLNHRNSLQGGMARTTGNTPWTTSVMDEHSSELFPFPANLCPKMDLLAERRNISDQAIADIIQPTIDDQFEWTFDETQPFLDIFSLNNYPETFHSFGDMGATSPSII